MTELRQSTAVTIKLGPFVDSSDGDTLEEGLAGSMTVKLSKNGGDIAARHSTDAITYDESGFYNVPLDATDTNTLGRLRILVVNAGTHLPVWADFMVVRQAYWDWKYGSADLAVDATKISGSATAADAVEANIGNLDAAVSTRAPASTALSKNTWTDERAGKLDYLDANVSSRASAEYYTSTRAAYLDHLNVGGLVASHADIQGITQASRIRIATSPQWERPDDGSTTYRIWIYHYNEQHQPEDLDSNPTVTVENEQGTDRSGNLGTVTKESGTTGVYYVDYTVADDHAVEGLIIKVSATENGETGVWAIGASVVDTTAVDFTSSDRQKLEAIKAQTDKLGFSDSNDVKATLDGEQVNLAADQEVNVTKWAGTSVSVGAASNLPSVSADAISDSAASADAVEANIANLDDKVSDITAQTSKLQFTAEGDVKATLDGEEVTTASLSTQAQNQVNQACDQALSDYNPAKPEDVEITVP